MFTLHTTHYSFIGQGLSLEVGLWWCCEYRLYKLTHGSYPSHHTLMLETVVPSKTWISVMVDAVGCPRGFCHLSFNCALPLCTHCTSPCHSVSRLDWGL